MSKTSFILGNIQGLKIRRHPHKINMLKELAFQKKSLIIGLTESHLNENIIDAEVYIDGFSSFRADRQGNLKGGIIVYIKDEWQSQVRVLTAGSIDLVEYLVLYIEKINLIFITVYRSPGSDRRSFSIVMNKIADSVVEQEHKCPSIILNGDFNFPDISFEHGLISDSRLTHQTLKNFASQFALIQKINQPTRIENILDLVFTNNEELFSNFSVDDFPSLSDHRLIIADTTIGFTRNDIKICADENSFRALNFHSEKVNWDRINEELSKIHWDNIVKAEDIDLDYDELCTTLLNICKKIVPKKKILTKPHIPRDRKILLKTQLSLKKRLVRSHGRRKTEIIGKLEQVHHKIAESHQKQIALQEKRAIEAIKRNSKYFFTYANSKSKLKTMIGPFMENNKLIEDPQGKANILKTQFESVFVNERIDDVSNEGTANPLSLSEIQFTEEDIATCIKELRTNAAAGPDELPAILLKNCIDHLKYPIFKLWKTSFDKGITPKKLKTGLISPIFKGGDRCKPENYRPVSLTSHITKIFEKIMAKAITNFFETNNLFNDEQHGFRSGRSCLSQLLAHHNSIIEGLEDGSDVDVIYLDFAKAFDKVHHVILLNKLRKLGICGKIHKWLESFLCGRTQKVSVEGFVSEESAVTSGVPQGTVLGPILFLIHIVDINKDVEHCRVSSFADDTRIVKAINKPDDRNLLQTDLNRIYDWSCENKMKFNNDKFEMVSYPVRPEDQTNHRYYTQNGHQIESQNVVKDLGITLSNDTYFTSNIFEKVANAKRFVGWIMRTFRSRGTLVMLTLFKAFVIPRIEYCCQLWNPHKAGEIIEIESVQKNFTSRIAGMDNLNYWQRLEALGLYSLERRRERYIIIYVWKIIRGLVPNVEGRNRIQTHTNRRLGLKCKIPQRITSATDRIQSCKDNNFFVNGPHLFNCLPKDIRECAENQDIFKRRLDEFLKKVPDQPSGHGSQYSRRAQNNSLTKQVPLFLSDPATSGSSSSSPQEE